ncbi:PIG-L deacetylase family protein [Cellulomonas aerilata]|uniref:GlcNAc-PI de-N-acetylase n=1 Tax=Cellulomonas aerilata TaxID=515326 RepID=A0A512DEP3_9CELL|nr:PIG-L family deacetylase [Cellulomonas aerilata]GEO34947.1 GlcNAc-PI de-N-acetylase [Cellulomonas aerilata]
MGRTLAIVVAHPDDESYSTYGTVARHSEDPAFRLVVLHATDGEGGQIADGVPATPETLGAWRRQEDDNAWRALGRMPDRHDWLGLPDGGLHAVGVDVLRETIAAFLREERPDVVCTLGSDGVTGHPDHIAMSAATTEAFHLVRSEPGPGLQRLLHGGIPQSFFERGQQWLRERGKPVWEPTTTYHLRGAPDELFGIRTDSRPFADRALAAIKEHRSQRQVIYDPEGTDEEWKKVLSRETWIIAWPPKAPGQPMLADVFEGLE